MRTRNTLTTLLVAAVLVVASCGGSDDDAGSSTTTDGATTTVSSTTDTTSTSTSTSTSSTTTTTTGGNGDAQERAEGANLTAEDLPASGWEATPHEDTGEPNLIEECAEDIDLEGTTLAKADSDDFTSGDLAAQNGQQIQSSSRVFEDAAAATEAVSAFSDEAFVACADTRLKAEFAGAEVLGNLKAQPAVTGYGDQAEGLSGQLSVTATNSEPVDVEIAVLAIRTGDIATVLSAFSVGVPIDEILPDLADAVAQRQAG